MSPRAERIIDRIRIGFLVFTYAYLTAHVIWYAIR